MPTGGWHDPCSPLEEFSPYHRCANPLQVIPTAGVVSEERIEDPVIMQRGHTNTTLGFSED
jgi:hypothetical protein